MRPRFCIHYMCTCNETFNYLWSVDAPLNPYHLFKPSASRDTERWRERQKFRLIPLLIFIYISSASSHYTKTHFTVAKKIVLCVWNEPQINQPFLAFCPSPQTLSSCQEKERRYSQISKSLTPLTLKRFAFLLYITVLPIRYNGPLHRI